MNKCIKSKIALLGMTSVMALTAFPSVALAQDEETAEEEQRGVTTIIVTAIIRTRDTPSISLGMYVVFTIGIGFWLVYGIALHSLPMILSNIVTFLLSSTILGLKLKHG